jgi:integrase
MAGTITKRGENKWLVRIFLGRDLNGKTIHLNKTINGPKKDAQKFLNEKLRERDLGINIESRSISLDKFLDQWLVDVAKPRLRSSTFSSYESVLKNYVRPALGNQKISEIQSYGIQSLYNSLRRRGLSARTIRYSHNVLSSAMKQAVRWKILVQNPCEHCELPRLEKSEMKCLSPQEARQFLAVAKTDKYFSLFLLAVETGMRPEEYLALRWSDIDFTNHTVAVRRAITWNRKGGGYSFTEPKTTKSRRNIPISDALIDELNCHRRNRLEVMMKFSPEVRKLDLVFTSEYGTPIQPKNLRDRHFFKILEEAGLSRVRLYDLRHTTATLLLSAGTNPKIVSERLGHASIVLTLDTYSHVLPSMQKEATEQLSHVLFGT